MTFFITAAVSLLVFGSVVLVHELGHFLAARAAGIRVEEFSVGIGPRLCGRVGKNGTRYSLRLLPLGGYNLFETPAAEDETDDDAQENTLTYQEKPLFPAPMENLSFEEAPPQQRFLVTLAGALMNFLLGAALMLALALSMQVLGSNRVADFTENAPSAAYLQAGDEILWVDGTRCRSSFSLLNCFDGTQKEHTLVIKRGNQVMTLRGVTVAPQKDENGALKSPIDFRVERVAKTPRAVLNQARDFFSFYSTMILRSFGDLATGKTGMDQLTGPVGTVAVVRQAISYGWQDVVSLMALLTINIGIFNLLPIPALDGCKLLFLAFESLTGHTVPLRAQAVINAAGMLALMGLMLFVTMQDVIRIF